MNITYKKKADTILARLQAKADRGTFYENLGQTEYSKFRTEVNADEDLSYSEQAELCLYFSEKTGHINPRTK